MQNKYNLNNEAKNKMISSIQSYYSEERDEVLGDLAATLLLDFFMKELAPHFYNQGVADSYKFISQKLDDLFEIQK